MENEKNNITSLFVSDTYPDFENAKKIAQSGKYRRIPVCAEIMADRFTPVEVLKTVKEKNSQTFLLESASQNHKWSRYSFIGFNPDAEITCKDGIVKISSVSEGKKTQIKEIKTDSPNEELRKIIKEYESPSIEGQPPFTGGLVGYFSYDYIKYAESSLSIGKNDEEGFNDADLMLFDDIIVFDNDKQKIIIIAGMKVPEGEVTEFELKPLYERAEAKIKEIIKLLADGNKKEFEPLVLEEELKHEFSEKEYCLMVEKAINYIKEGDIFQVVLSNPITAKARGSIFDTYRLLRTQNPSPYMFYFSGDDLEIAGASPETLVKIENNSVNTFPLAGTRARGKTREEDEMLEKELLADEKEKAEHNMLVDLGRNDIGRISEDGSVVVEKYMNIERFSQVMHISSTVSGRIRKDKDALDAIDAILPAGTLSGAPKIRACQIIDELEGKKRGIYGGAIGYKDFTGNLDTCIGIRLVYKKNGKVCVRSGAGIVYDSIAKNEYRECVNKAAAIVKALKQSEI